MIAMAERLGITTFTAPDYGLALTLGGGDVSLLEPRLPTRVCERRQKNAAGCHPAHRRLSGQRDL